MDLTYLKNNFENELSEMVTAKNWKQVISLSESYKHDLTSNYLWCWPSEFCLSVLKMVLDANRITSLLSLGCGCGLLEWILSESLGVKIVGVEIDSKWWSSKHSPTHFIELQYLEENEEITEEFLLQNNENKDWTFALFFCYFNNRPAFNKYVEAYKGNHIIIIGPAKDTNRYTEPDPLEPNFEEDQHFDIVHCSKFGDNRDFIAVYERRK